MLANPRTKEPTHPPNNSIHWQRSVPAGRCLTESQNQNTGWGSHRVRMGLFLRDGGAKTPCKWCSCSEIHKFTFYRIPKALFTEERFRTVTIGAKVLYGLLLDRMCLSVRNGWLDDQGRVYIIFTLREVMSALGCAVQKAAKLLAELEKKAGLIERKRQGLGKPGLIYVKNFIPTAESKIRNCENQSSGTMKIKNQELR